MEIFKEVQDKYIKIKLLFLVLNIKIKLLGKFRTAVQAKAALFLIPILGTYFVLLPMRPAVGTRLGTETCAA